MKKQWIQNWFSNMIPFESPFVHEGISYPAVENFYQAMKTLDISSRQAIALMEPRKSKAAGRKLEVRPDWSEIKLKVMETGLRHKFQLGTKWGKQLLETEGEIVEHNNWGDKFFGVDIESGKGFNHLGKLLMKIREDLKWEKLDLGDVVRNQPRF